MQLTIRKRCVTNNVIVGFADLDELPSAVGCLMENNPGVHLIVTQTKDVDMVEWQVQSLTDGDNSGERSEPEATS